jgi:hypothetical protein
MTPFIFLDTAVGSKELINYPPFDQHAQLRPLKAGDIMSLGYGPDNQTIKVLFEVKDIGELYSSTLSGRLPGGQLPRMLKETPYVYLIYYPHIGCGPQDEVIRLDGSPSYGGMRYSILQKWFTEFEQCGIRVRSAFDQSDIVNMAYSIICFYRKRWTDHQLMHCSDMSCAIDPTPSLMPRFTDKERKVVRTLSTFDEVGFKLASRAMRFFGSIVDAVQATPMEWRTIEGIGRTKADRIVEYLNTSRLR